MERETRILAVDDEPLVLQLLRIALEKHGYAVSTARSGPEALRVLDECPGHIDLMITDIRMPEMNGLVLAEKVRVREPGLPVLFVSGFADPAERMNGNLLRKPFSPAALIGRVQKLLNTHRE